MQSEYRLSNLWLIICKSFIIFIPKIVQNSNDYLPNLSFWVRVSCIPNKPSTVYVAKGDLKFLVDLPLPSTCLDYKITSLQPDSAVLRIKCRFSCLLTMHSISNSTSSSALFFSFVFIWSFVSPLFVPSPHSALLCSQPSCRYAILWFLSSLAPISRKLVLEICVTFPGPGVVFVYPWKIETNY